jgi:hypothetical protein
MVVQIAIVYAEILTIDVKLEIHFQFNERFLQNVYADGVKQPMGRTKNRKMSDEQRYPNRL